MTSRPKTPLHRGKRKASENGIAVFPDGAVPLLLNRRQVRAYLGVGRDRLRVYERHKAFPTPLADSTTNHPIWLREHVESFARALASEGQGNG